MKMKCAERYTHFPCVCFASICGVTTAVSSQTLGAI